MKFIVCSSKTKSHYSTIWFSRFLHLTASWSLRSIVVKKSWEEIAGMVETDTRSPYMNIKTLKLILQSSAYWCLNGKLKDQCKNSIKKECSCWIRIRIE